MAKEYIYSGKFLGGLISITYAEFFMGFFSIIVFCFLIIQFFKKYREKFYNINKHALLLLPIISISTIFLLVNILVGIMILSISLIMGIVALKYFEHKSIDKILFYLFFIYGFLNVWFVYGAHIAPSPGMGSGIALGFFAFLFYLIFLIWFIIKFSIKITLANKLKDSSSNLKQSFKQKTFPQKMGLIFVILTSLLNIFIIYGIQTCKDLGCLSVGLFSFATGIGFLGLVFSYFILNANMDSFLFSGGDFWTGVAFFIFSLILIPAYYFIGKFIGWILSKILNLSRK